MKPLTITLDKVQAAKHELSKYLEPSPLLRNTWLSETMGCEIYLKLENMQPIGSFKIRGATYRISKLTKAEKRAGVIAASAGNHAQGVAWGSRQLGAKATIVMPEGAALVKVQNTKALGAEIILRGHTYDEAFVHAKSLARKTGMTLVHAFEDEAVISGQGTVALEILDQLPEVECVMCSVGGGGLIGGVASVFKALQPKVKIVGCQAAGASAMLQSIRAGKSIILDHLDTFADGIAVLKSSDPMRRLLTPLVDEWVEATEISIAASVLTLLEKAKVVSEGSGAVPLAALEKIKKKLSGKKVVLVVSGGNIDVNLLSRIIELGLIQTGRRLRINVWVLDRPGSLAKLTGLIAKQGANILQAIHDRNEHSTGMNQTEIALAVETRGPEHSRQLIRELKNHVLRLELGH